MTRRGTREGTIRQRSSGLWEARYRANDGRRLSVYGPTQHEVVAKLREALRQIDHGVRPPDTRLTVGEWLDAWLDTSVRPRLRPGTVTMYETLVRLYLKPRLGAKSLAKLTPEDVQGMLTTLAAGNGKRGKPLSPTTVRSVYAVLGIALGRALKQGRVLRNVCTLVDPPAKARHELTPPTADESRTFLAFLEGDRLEPLLTTAIALGMRQGELLALRWRDVDLDAGTLTVRHTLQRSTCDLAETKTERSRRTLTLPGSVVRVLRAHKARQAVEQIAAGDQWAKRDFVFTTPEGNPLDARNVLRAYQLRLERAGLPRFRFHDLRHACATLLLEEGEELGVISKMLGHANLATTADVYAHLTPAMSQRVAARMDVILSRKAAG